MTGKTEDTFLVKLYLSGPIEIAKQILREECLREGLCVTIEPTTFIYTGGEEVGYVVGMIQYPRFPSTPDKLIERGRAIMDKLMRGTFQHSALLMTPISTEWITTRQQYEDAK